MADLRALQSYIGMIVCPPSREGGIADDLGLEVEPGAGFKARKRARDKERRHKKAAAKGVRSKDLPPEVSALMGQANLAYAQSKCAPLATPLDCQCADSDLLPLPLVLCCSSVLR